MKLKEFYPYRNWERSEKVFFFNFSFLFFTKIKKKSFNFSYRGENLKQKKNIVI